MHQRTIRRVAAIALALVIALAGVHQARAAGAVNIDSCQILSVPNTVYKLTADLNSCGTCLVVTANKITIDLQGHSITSTGCPAVGAAISDEGNVFDVITVKNGTVSGYNSGVALVSSTRVSVLGVTAHDNDEIGIWVGSQALVKASETYNNAVGIEVIGDRGQIQQCNSHDNGATGIAVSGNNCLITMNTANANRVDGIRILGNKCTVSYNTANGSVGAGIAFDSTFSGDLVTQNVAMNNVIDYIISCPSEVTNNTSSNGFPASYVIQTFVGGPDCHFVNNN